LQVSDFITGQTDRHAGNIFIDPTTGKVTGIDNDLAFPEMGLNKLSGEAKENVVGLPRMMHAETRDKILAVDPKEFRKMLSVPPPKPGPDPLSKAAINSAVGRLELLQKELTKSNSSIEVVQQFDKETHRKALKQQDDAFKKEVNFWQPNVVAQGMHEYGQLTDAKKATLHGRIKDSYNTAPKTSYVGTVELEMAKNRVQSGNAILPEHNNIPQTQRLPEPALEKKLAMAYARMTKGEQRTFDRQFEQLNKMEEELADKQKHLQHPGLVDRFNAIGKGMTAVMQQKSQNAQTLSDNIEQLKANLEQSADKKLGISKSVGQGIGSSKSESVLRSSSQSLDSGSDGPDLAGDNARSEGDDISQKRAGKRPMLQPKVSTVREDLEKEGIKKPRKTRKQDLSNTNAPEKTEKVDKVANNIELGERKKIRRGMSISK
jgi:hypothetical protein